MTRLSLILTVSLALTAFTDTNSIVGEYSGKCYGKEWCSLKIEKDNDFVFYVEGNCFPQGTYRGIWALHLDTLILTFKQESQKFKDVEFGNNEEVKYLFKKNTLTSINEKGLSVPEHFKKTKS